MAEKRWTKVGGSDGDLIKFEKAGQALEGVWHGTRPGRFGDLGMMTLAGGKNVAFPIHTALVDKVKRLKDGAEIQIVYLGTQESKQGRKFKAFDVFVADAAALVPEDEAAHADDDVPF